MVNVIDEIHELKESDLELFEQARNRVQRKIKGRCVTNKDVIVDQEKEIEQYRKRNRTIQKKNRTIQKKNRTINWNS